MTASKWKKVAITSMAVMTLLSGASTAFAHDNGHGKGKGKDDDKKKDDNNISINLHFKDADDMKWAEEYIIRLASKGVFNGYQDGTFKPAQKISRIETLVAAVRLMGLREQAESAAEMSTELNFKDADQLKKKYPWAVGYVAVALENDLFSETEDSIQPEKPATRLWSATILVKALKLEAEAKAKSNTKLAFKDAKQIPAGSVGYVAVALEKGLITGYQDNSFRPNQQVSRAELAALLDRTDTQMPNNDAQAITGTLKATVSNGSIVVVKADKTEATLALDPNVFIFRDNKKAAITDLKAGDEVLVRTYQNKVIFVDVTKSVVQNYDDQAITGSLKAAAANGTIVIVKPDKTELTLALDPNVYVYRDNKQAAVSDLKAGDEVLVRTNQNKVIIINVTKLVAAPTIDAGIMNTVTLNAQGKLATISIIRSVNGAAQSAIYNVDPNVVISGDASKLLTGQAVELTIENNAVKVVVIK
ncbi:S-layer homology domain-containing protein [Paenibacillus kobensis]|uniref:S-layer homology domain-containing protein n=1 Tax=Paenibacillus kobensis TaxID=59841 RepID=UPI000FD79FBF|nr:S-layer homology domain-containing protein [Paenibacillus kobensis]